MFTSYLNAFRSLNRNVLLHFAAISVIGFTVDGGVFSVVFNLFLLRLGYEPDFIGQVNFAGLITFAIFSLPAGALGNWLGNRWSMILGLVIMMVSSVLLALVEFAPVAWQANWLLLTYPISFIGIAIYFVNTAPYMMSMVTEGQRNYAFSIQSAMISFSAFLGSMLGGVLPGVFATTLALNLDSAIPYRYPLLIAAIMVNMGIIVLLRAQNEESLPLRAQPSLHPPLQPRRAYASLLRVPRFRRVNWRVIGTGFVGLMAIIALIRVLQIAGMAVAMTFFNVYMDDGLGAPTSQVGYMAGVARLLSVPIVLAMPLMSARWGNQRLIIWATLSAFVFMLPLALIPNPFAAGIGYMGIMAGSSIRYTAFMVFSMGLVKPEQRSILSGISEMTAGLSFALMALIGGQIIVSQGYTMLFLLGAGFSLLGTFIFWGYFGTSPKPATPSPQPSA